MKRFWLFKSDPEFGVSELRASGKGGVCWDGVRNYQARNFLRDQVQLGDGVAFYMAGVKQPHIAALAQVTRDAYADPSQFLADSPYFDPNSSFDAPRWISVDIALCCELKSELTRKRLMVMPDWQDSPLLRKGNRLSVLPLSPRQWQSLLPFADDNSLM